MVTITSHTETLADQRLLPLLEHLARVGRRAGEAKLEPGGLRPRHLIALRLLSEQGPVSQQGLAESLSLDPSRRRATPVPLTYSRHTAARSRQ